MKLISTFFFIVATLSAPALWCQAGELPEGSARAPERLELRDQYDTPHSLEFPATNVVVMTIADHKGSTQIDGWIGPIKERYSGRITILGIADVGKVPGIFRNRLRRKFREQRAHPVMLDWDGQVCDRFNRVLGLANVLIIAPDGAIRADFTGAATPKGLSAAYAVLDKLLAAP